MPRPETCSRCGEEVRYGVRDGVTGWLHRDPSKDHMPLFGRLWTPEDQVRVEASLAEMAARGKADKKKDDAPAADDDGPQEWDVIPEPEVRCTEVAVADLRPRSGLLQMANLVLRTDGWDLKPITYARGPWVGARGQVLSISDHHKLSATGPMLDNGQAFVVGCWRDMEFKTGYVGVIRDGTVYPEPANSNAIKAFIKETS